MKIASGVRLCFTFEYLKHLVVFNVPVFSVSISVGSGMTAVENNSPGSELCFLPLCTPGNLLQGIRHCNFYPDIYGYFCVSINILELFSVAKLSWKQIDTFRFYF